MEDGLEIEERLVTRWANGARIVPPRRLDLPPVVPSAPFHGPVDNLTWTSATVDGSFKSIASNMFDLRAI